MAEERGIRRVVTRSVAFAAGLGIAAALVVDGAHAVAPRDPAASVRISVAPTSEIEVIPSGMIIDEPALRPGTPVTGETHIRNITGVPRNLSMVARSQDVDLDEVLTLEIRAGGVVVFDDTLGALRRGSTQVQLTSGQRVTVSMAGSLPAHVAAAGRSADVEIDLVTRPEPGAP